MRSAIQKAGTIAAWLSLSTSTLLPFGCQVRGREDFGDPQPSKPIPTLVINEEIADNEGISTIELSEVEFEVQLSNAMNNQYGPPNMTWGMERLMTPSDPTIKELSHTLSRGYKTKEAAASEMLSWVKSTVTQTPETLATSVRTHRYPIEVIAERAGESRDTSILFASLCMASDIEVVLLQMEDHVAVGVNGHFNGSFVQYRGKDFYIAETRAEDCKDVPVRALIGLPSTLSPAAQSVRIIGPWVDGIASSGNLTLTVPATLLNEREGFFGSRYLLAHDDEHKASFVERDVAPLKPVSDRITMGLSTIEEKATALLNFVQANVTYTSDGENKDYFQFPIETLIRKKGDCEDSTLLYAALCRAADIDLILINPPAHLAAAVKGNFSGTYFEFNGEKYFYAETTKNGGAIGREFSVELKGATANLISLQPATVTLSANSGGQK